MNKEVSLLCTFTQQTNKQKKDLHPEVKKIINLLAVTLSRLLSVKYCKDRCKKKKKDVKMWTIFEVSHMAPADF